jgi:signal transduction histidine kinase
LDDRRGPSLAALGARSSDPPAVVDALYSILSDSLALEHVSANALPIVAGALGATRAELWIADGSSNVRRLVAAFGDASGALAPGASLPLGDDWVGRSFATGRAVEWVDPNTRSFATRALPLGNPGSLVGALVVSAPSDQPIRAERAAAVASALARVVAVAVAHEAAIRERMFRYERLSLVGQIAASTAHEVNNILLNVSLRAQKIVERMPDDAPEDLREAARVIEEEVGKIGRILHALLQPAKAKREPRAATSLSDVVHRTLDLVSPIFSKSRRIRVEDRCAHELPDVFAEASELEQVFTNLILNAVQAMPSGGSIRVFTRAEDDWVVAGVADSGPGIPKEALAHVFEPFFTTRGAQGGTGLGLTVVKEIVKSHGGEIEVETTEGVGTEFRVRLRRAAESGGDRQDLPKPGR